MKKHARVFAILLTLTTVCLGLGAQETWSGEAIVGRFGEFPDGGFYGRSSAFAANTIVDVTNTANDQIIRVIIVAGSEDPGPVLVLSEAAASELRIMGSEAAAVSARTVALPGLTTVDPNEDVPFSSDPDINPAAAVGNPNPDLVDGESIEEATRAPTTDDTVEIPAPPTVTRENSIGAIAPAATIAPDDVIGLEPLLPRSTDEPTAGLVEPSLEQERRGRPEQPVGPPRSAEEDPLIVVLGLPGDPAAGSALERGLETEQPTPVAPSEPTVTTEPVAATTAEPAADPIDERLSQLTERFQNDRSVIAPLVPGSLGAADLEPGASSEARDSTAIDPPVETPTVVESSIPNEPATPQIEEGTEPHEASAPPERIVGESEITLQPAEFRAPPAVRSRPEADDSPAAPSPSVATVPAPPARDPRAEGPAVAADLPIVDALDPTGSYVQVAAFSNRAGVRSSLDRLGERYPIAVVPAPTGQQELYRLFVGPIARDETGATLFDVRSRGFRDAFVRN